MAGLQADMAGEAVACGDRKDAAERYERTGHDRQYSQTAKTH